MRRTLFAILCLIGVVTSASWLVGYGRAIWPYAGEGIRDRDFAFLTWPNIKWYTERDQQTGVMSEVKVDWFSVADGPTGVVYAQSYFPCWIVALIAAAIFIASVGCGIFLWSRRDHGRP